MTSERRKTVPIPSPDSLPFWEGCRRGELLIPFCPSCRAHFFYPRLFCPRCFGQEVEWRRSSGRGVLYTFAIQYRPLNPEWVDDIPYVTAIVELEEGVRLFTLLVECEPDPEKVRCGMPVEVVFDPVSEEITIPRFRPLKETP